MEFFMGLKFCQTALSYIWQSKKLQFPLISLIAILRIMLGYMSCKDLAVQGTTFSPEVNEFSYCFYNDSASGFEQTPGKTQKKDSHMSW